MAEKLTARGRLLHCAFLTQIFNLQVYCEWIFHYTFKIDMVLKDQLSEALIKRAYSEHKACYNEGILNRHYIYTRAMYVVTLF